MIATAGVKLDGGIGEYQARSLQGPSDVFVEVAPVKELNEGRFTLSIRVYNSTDRALAFTNVSAAAHGQPLTLIGKDQLFTEEMPGAMEAAGEDYEQRLAKLVAEGRDRVARERLATPKFGLVHPGNTRYGIATFQLATHDNLMNWPLPVTLSIEVGGIVHRFELLVIPWH